MPIPRILSLIPILCISIGLMASDADPASAAKEALATESEARCVATAKDKATAELIVQKVAEAAALVAKDGEAAYAKLKGKDSPFLFCGTYIWIHDEKGVMLCHPVKWKMENKPLIELSDTKGKKIFVEMNRLAEAKGKGWIDYWWPKPGEKASSYKVSYVQKVVKDGRTYILGCGSYDLTEAEGAKLVAGN